MTNLGRIALVAALAGMSMPMLGAVSHGPRVRGLTGITTARRKDARERVPKMLRQYAKRYGGLGPDAVLQVHAQFRVPMLDHARDRRLRQMARSA